MTEQNRNLGQYFTRHIDLKNKVLEFIHNDPYVILEPSIGQGHLIHHINLYKPDIQFDMYEIDDGIELLEGVVGERVIYGDFIQQQIPRKYNTIIGNPPYIRKKTGNLYIEFTNKCYNLLEENGELIFIVPSDFLKLTSASKLLDEMMQNGTFTHIFHPHNEKMFENANIDIIVFRYCKNATLAKTVLYNDQVRFIINSGGLITFEETRLENTVLFKDHFDIYVGIVSGKEDVYKNELLGNIDVINGENKTDRYIYIETFPCERKDVNEYLLSHKKVLIERRIRKFSDNNWFEWGAPRNMTAINKNIGGDCIYLRNLTRNSTIAFAGKVNYFGGSLIMLIPKYHNNNNNNLSNIVEYMNSPEFKSNFEYSGRFKIGHRQISNSFIPGDLIL